MGTLAGFRGKGKSLRDGKPAGDNPWDAPTLEWSIPSPPPVYNFREIPQVTARDQLWADKYGHGPHHAEPVLAPVRGGEEPAAHAEHGDEEYATDNSRRPVAAQLAEHPPRMTQHGLDGGDRPGDGNAVIGVLADGRGSRNGRRNGRRDGGRWCVFVHKLFA